MKNVQLNCQSEGMHRYSQHNISHYAILHPQHEAIFTKVLWQNKQLAFKLMIFNSDVQRVTHKQKSEIIQYPFKCS